MRGTNCAGSAISSMVAQGTKGSIGALRTIDDSITAGQTGRPADVVASNTSQAKGGSRDASSTGRGARLSNGVVGSVIVVSTLRRASRQTQSPVHHTAVASCAGGCIGAGVAVVETLLACHSREIPVPANRALIVAQNL